MLALTHGAIAATAVSFGLGTMDPAILALSVLGSQLPDLDTSESLVGQIAFPVSRWVEANFPHRTLTHSFLATGAIALFSSPLFYFLNWKCWCAIWIGHLVACFSDTFTKKGVQLFWPQPVWCVCGLNPNRRLSTGGAGEYWVLAIAVLLLLLNVKLTSAGGILQQTSQVLDLRSNLVQLYNQNAASKQVWAEVKGLWSSDRMRADGRYFILGTQGSEFVLSDGKTVFVTGKQLIVEKLKVQPGDPATLQVLTAKVTEEPGEVLGQLRREGAAVFLSGQLAVDAEEPLVLPVAVRGMETILAGEGRVMLEWARLEEAIGLLHDQYITGSITVRVITPSPWGGGDRGGN